MMLQQEKLLDFVIATGRQESERSFNEITAKELSWGSIKRAGSGLVLMKLGGEKIPINVIRINEKYFRPTEVYTLLGDATFAKEKLGL